MFAGSNEEKKTAYKYFIQLAKERGVYEDHIVIEKDYVKAAKFGGKTVLHGFGFIKCLIVPESLEAYAKGKFQGKMIATLPKVAAKTTGKVIDVEEKVSCIAEFNENLWTSREGIDAMKQGLCIMGENEYCDNR